MLVENVQLAACRNGVIVTVRRGEVIKLTFVLPLHCVEIFWKCLLITVASNCWIAGDVYESEKSKSKNKCKLTVYPWHGCEYKSSWFYAMLLRKLKKRQLILSWLHWQWFVIIKVAVTSRLTFDNILPERVTADRTEYGRKMIMLPSRDLTELQVFRIGCWEIRESGIMPVSEVRGCAMKYRNNAYLITI